MPSVVDQRASTLRLRSLPGHLYSCSLLPILVILLIVFETSSARSQDRNEPKQSLSPLVGGTDRGERPKINRDPAKAAALVRQLYESEKWINSIRSLMIRNQINQLAVKARNPGQNDYSRTETWIWDSSRIRHDHLIRDAKNQPITSSSSEIWDASRKIFDSRSNDVHQYSFGENCGQWFARTGTNSLFNAWKIASVNRFWWLPTDIGQSQADHSLSAEDFEMAGQEEVNGHVCQIVRSPAGHRQFSIGIDDGRMYQHTFLAVTPNVAGKDPMALYRKIGGDAIRTRWHWQAWLQSLDPKEQKRVLKEVAASDIESMLPQIVETLDDYREVLPGCWFPLHRRIDFNEFEENPVDKSIVAVAKSSMDIRVEELIVNEMVPDELFEIELKDGVKVAHDSRYDPPITYDFRKDQTEDERKALAVAEKTRRKEAAAQRDMPLKTIKSRVGQAPIGLPKDGWIGGKALNWESLQGKVVIIHFFDVTSTNSQSEQELPVLQISHDKRDQAGVVVFGVHRPTQFTDQLEMKLNEYGVTYPVVIDLPSADGFHAGQLHEWFGAEWCPFSVIIDQKGLVAGYGQLTGAFAVDRNGIHYGYDESFLPAIRNQILKLTATK